MDYSIQVPHESSNEQAERSIHSEEIGAVVAWPAVRRSCVFCDKPHLYFHRTLPSFVSSTRIPDAANCLRISSERLKSRPRFAMLRSATSASTCSVLMRGSSVAKP